MAGSDNFQTMPAEVAETNIDLVLKRLPAGSLSAALAKAWQGDLPKDRSTALLNALKTHGLPKQATDESDTDK